MSKKLFILLEILMSLSLIGIISVQAYYIKNSIDNEKEQFTFNVKKALSFTAEEIENKELNSYFQKYQRLVDQQKQADSVAITNFKYAVPTSSYSRTTSGQIASSHFSPEQGSLALTLNVSSRPGLLAHLNK